VPPSKDRSLKYIQADKGTSFLLGDYFPIPYNDDVRIRITKYLEYDRLVPYLPYETPDLNPIELNHLNYLLLSLDAFFSQANKFHTDKNKLVYTIMDWDGPKALKRKRIKSFLQSNKSKLIEEPTWWKDTESIYIDDIGEIFNYNYAMFWEARDEHDYLISQQPLNLDSEIVKEFENLVNEIIDQSEDFEYIRREEILLRTSSSKTLYNGKSVPNYSVKEKCMSFSSRRSPGKRVLITTGPGQGRDAILNTVEDLNTIQFINENIRVFLEKNFRSFLLLGNAEKNKNKFFKTCSRNQVFYARDIKKEGITKPKYICKIILEALRKRFPDCEAFGFSSFYDGPWFDGDKGHRGHGLGMANELTTLMQILLYVFTNRKLGEEGSYIGSSKGYFLNDDAIIFFKEDDESIEDFVDMDFYLCECLGIMAQKDKSFLSKHCCVFCEMYYARVSRSINRKESYELRESSILLRSSSILEAKFLLGNLKGSLDQIENILRKVYAKLGYEFSPKEIQWPLTVGGLRPMKLRGTDFSLKYIFEEFNSLGTIFRAYTANKNRKLWSYNKLIKDYKAPILSLYPQLLNCDPEILAKLNLGSNFDLACLFFRPSKEHKFHSSIRKLEEKRQKIFSETPSSIEESQFVELYSTNCNSNTWIPEKYIERYIPVKFFTMKNFKDPYSIRNPISCLLNFLEIKLDTNLPKTRWGLYQSDSSLLFEKSVFARSRTLNTLSLIDRFEEDIDIDLLVFPEKPEDIEDFMVSYPKPFLTSELVKNGNKLPIPKEKFRNKQLECRKEVYGVYLQYYHIILSQTYAWRVIRNIIIFEQLNKFDGYNLDFWQKVLEKEQLLKSKKEIDELSSSNSSDNDDDPFSFKLDLKPFKMEINSLLGIEEPPIIPEVELSITEQIEKEMRERDSKNPFYIMNGELPDGDISVYGSKEWVKWLVRQDASIIDEYGQSDEYLDFAADAVVRFKRQAMLSSMSNLITIKEEREALDRALKKSWLAVYFGEYLQEPEEEIEINYNVDDLFS